MATGHLLNRLSGRLVARGRSSRDAPSLAPLPHSPLPSPLPLTLPPYTKQLLFCSCQSGALQLDPETVGRAELGLSWAIPPHAFPCAPQKMSLL